MGSLRNAVRFTALMVSIPSFLACLTSASPSGTNISCNVEDAENYFSLILNVNATKNSPGPGGISSTARLGELENTVDLHLKCSTTPRGNSVKTHATKTNPNKIELVGLKEKLFGSNRTQKESVFVTKDQMTSLASEIYTQLNIDEEYRITEVHFIKLFVDSLTNQTMLKNDTTIEDVVRNLSHYGLDVETDFEVSEIIRDMGDQVIDLKPIRNSMNVNVFLVVVDPNKKVALENKVKESYGMPTATVPGFV
jgi:hypothetical protein